MVFGKHFRPALGGVTGKGDRIATFGMSVFLGLMLLLMLGGCGSGSGGGGNNNNGNNGGNSTAQVTRLTGRVIDQNNNNNPVAGATVSYGGATGVTNNTGSFTLSVSPNLSSTSLTVTGPANPDGSAAYYSTGYVASQQYSLSNVGFPVAAITAGQTVDVGTVIIFSQTGPPPPPIFP